MGFEKVEGEDFSQTKPFEFMKMKNEGLVPSTKTLYSEELIRIVRNVYKDDFALYEDVIGADTLMFQK